LSHQGIILWWLNHQHSGSILPLRWLNIYRIDGSQRLKYPKGKIIVEIPIRELGKQKRLLDFTVSASDDDTPFLKHTETTKWL